MTTEVMTAPAAAPAEPAYLVDATEAARLCGVSRTTWYALVAADKTPAQVKLPVRVGRWRRQELADWIAAGCPDRRAWELLQAKR